MNSVRTKVGAVIARPAFTKLKMAMDPAEIGAAALLGIDGLLFVGHGRSDEIAIANSIHLADQIIKANLLDAVSIAIQERLSLM